MVGSQMKYSNMVKGRQHDQTFDETLEFVLAAGQLCWCLKPKLLSVKAAVLAVTLNNVLDAALPGYNTWHANSRATFPAPGSGTQLLPIGAVCSMAAVQTDCIAKCTAAFFCRDDKVDSHCLSVLFVV